jgi:hypothetical protein
MAPAKSPLRAYWIAPPPGRGPIGFGVTAYSLRDALAIIRDSGYELPEDVASLEIIEDVRVDAPEPWHVRANMGPIVVRGMWYPFRRVGL